MVKLPNLQSWYIIWIAHSGSKPFKYGSGFVRNYSCGNFSVVNLIREIRDNKTNQNSGMPGTKAKTSSGVLSPKMASGAISEHQIRVGACP